MFRNLSSGQQPAGGQRPPTASQPTSNVALSQMHNRAVASAAPHLGLVPTSWPTPTTGQISYPGYYSKPTDHHYRQGPSGEPLRREPDHSKKRLSLLSNFHNPVVSSHSMMSGAMDKNNAGSSMKEPISKAELIARRSLQLDVPTYTPQVENISPTPDDQNEHLDKKEISENIGKVDREIAIVEENLKKLRKKKQDLEETTGKDISSPLSADGGNEAQNGEETKSESLFEKIYAENRKKAESAHAKLANLNPPGGIVPDFQQPWDMKIFEDLRKRYEEFKPRLLLYLKRMHHSQQIREKYLTERYNQQMQEWKKKMERFERHPKRIAKEQRNREVFEKTFPELKKSREEKERLIRSEGRTSILGQNDISFEMVSMQEEEELLKMRQNAVLPPMMYDERTRKRMCYVNNNNLVRDPVAEHQDRLNYFKISWTEDERRIFREKFVQYGKNFAAISAFLERKNTKDCVQYYYLTKKKENFKQLTRRPYRRRGKPYKPPQVPRVGDSSKDFGDNQDPDISISNMSEENTPVEHEYFCIECKSKIDISNPGRVLTRSCYEQYGLDPLDPGAQDIRICLKCRLGSVRRRFAQCPIGSCTSNKRRIKPRVFPTKWFELSADQKKSIAIELQMTEDTTRCCGSCQKRIHRKVELMLGGECNDAYLSKSSSGVFHVKQEPWKDDDLQRLKDAIVSFGLNNWDTVASNMIGKSAEECRDMYYNNIDKSSASESKRAAKVGQVYGIEEEEDEDEGGMSEDEDNGLSTTSVSNSCLPSPKPFNANENSNKLGLKSTKPNESPSDFAGALIIDEAAAGGSSGGLHQKPTLSASCGNNNANDRSSSAQHADDDSCATLSADEMESGTERVEDDGRYMTVDKSAGAQKSHGKSVILPENLPKLLGQPYKPKSRQIRRVEEENRRAAAFSAAHPPVSKPSLLEHIQPLASVLNAAASLPPKNFEKSPAEMAILSQQKVSSRDAESPDPVIVAEKIVSKSAGLEKSFQQATSKTSTKVVTAQHQQDQQPPQARGGSITKGTPVLPPYIVGGDGSGQQKTLDVAKLFRQPTNVKLEDAARAASADNNTTLSKDPSVYSNVVEQARFTPMDQQQQHRAGTPTPFGAPPVGGPSPMSYDQYVRQQQQQQHQLLQQQAQAKQNYDFYSQAAIFNSLPFAAQAQLLTALHLQQQQQQGGASQAELAIRQLEAHKALYQNRALEQQQQQQMEQQQQQRMLMAAGCFDPQRLAEIRMLEQYREQQQQDVYRAAELVALRQQQQQQQQQGEALRQQQQQQQGEAAARRATELALKERELVAEYHHQQQQHQQQQQQQLSRPQSADHQKLFDAQQRMIKSPSGFLTNQQQQQMLEAHFMFQHQQALKSGVLPPHLISSVVQQQQQQQQKMDSFQQRLQQQSANNSPLVYQQQQQSSSKSQLLNAPQQHQVVGGQRSSPMVGGGKSVDQSKVGHGGGATVGRQSIIQQAPVVKHEHHQQQQHVKQEQQQPAMAVYDPHVKRPDSAVLTKAAMKDFSADVKKPPIHHHQQQHQHQAESISLSSIYSKPSLLQSVQSFAQFNAPPASTSTAAPTLATVPTGPPFVVGGATNVVAQKMFPVNQQQQQPIQQARNVIAQQKPFQPPPPVSSGFSKLDVTQPFQISANPPVAVETKTPVANLIASSIMKHMANDESPKSQHDKTDRSSKATTSAKTQQHHVAVAQAPTPPRAVNVQKLEQWSSTNSLTEQSAKPPPPPVGSVEKWSSFRQQTSTTTTTTSSMTSSVITRPASLLSDSANIIKHIDDVIIGEIVQQQHQPVARQQEQLKQKSVAKQHQPIIEPVTPDSAPSSTMTSFAFESEHQRQHQQQKPPLLNVPKQMSSSFEYDLEPVSPPDQSLTLEPLAVPPPHAPTPPLEPVPSGSWQSANNVIKDISPDLAQQPSSAAVPPFMAFNVFTLPTTAVAAGNVVVQPSTTAPPLPWQQQQQHVTSNAAEDNESTRAVAALIETELQNDSGSGMAAMCSIEEPQDGTAVSMATTATTILPTYEPLSDDEC